MGDVSPDSHVETGPGRVYTGKRVQCGQGLWQWKMESQVCLSTANRGT